MKMSSLLRTQHILRVNWIIAPALGIWIWAQRGFFNAVLFIIVWLLVDKVWDWLTGLLITGTARIGANEEEAFEMARSGEVPKRMACMMIVDLVGTVILPWVIVGLFFFCT